MCLFLKKIFSTNIYPQCQLLLSQAFWTPFLSVFVSVVCITQYVSPFSVFYICSVNYSGFIWCWFFSFLTGVMCLFIPFTQYILVELLKSAKRIRLQTFEGRDRSRRGPGSGKEERAGPCFLGSSFWARVRPVNTSWCGVVMLYVGACVQRWGQREGSIVLCRKPSPRVTRGLPGDWGGVWPMGRCLC